MAEVESRASVDWKPLWRKGILPSPPFDFAPSLQLTPRLKPMNYNETAPYSEFKPYTITDLEDCKNHLANSSQTRARAKEELEYRHTTKEGK